MTQKFYLHDATTTVTGTLPGGTDLSSTAPSVTATGASTNRTMDGTIGSSQASATLNTLAQTTEQNNWFRRFVSPQLAANAGFTEAWTVHIGASEASTNSNMGLSAWLGVWRPSTGALVGPAGAGITGLGGATEPGTTQTALTGTKTMGSLVAWQDGDVVVLEVWAANLQSMGSAYANTIFYDGTTEGSTTSIAAYLNSPFDLPLYTPPAAGRAVPRYPHSHAVHRAAAW